MPRNNRSPTQEVRFCNQSEVRAIQNEDNTITFSGYAANFNEWSMDLGWFKEKIAVGAFTNALKTDDIRALLNHDPNYVLGRNRSGTASLWEDQKGLAFEVKAPDTQWARDLKVSVDRGDINQCSFRFEKVTDEWSHGTGLSERTLKEVHLSDVSIVTFPAYVSTSASVRSAIDVYNEHRAQTQTENNKLRDRLNLKNKELLNHE